MTEEKLLEIYGKHIGINQEMEYQPTPREWVLDAMKEAIEELQERYDTVSEAYSLCNTDWELEKDKNKELIEKIHKKIVEIKKEIDWMKNNPLKVSGMGEIFYNSAISSATKQVKLLEWVIGKGK